MNRREIMLRGTAMLAAFGGVAAVFKLGAPSAASAETFAVTKTDAEWRAVLSDAEFAVLREESTERAGTSGLLHEKRKGTFHCAGCDLPAYSSETKYDSGTGWPSFWAALPGAVGLHEDTSLLMVRTECHCSRCGGHFGHVFDDGPKPTGKRHCINGVALGFKPAVA